MGCGTAFLSGTFFSHSLSGGTPQPLERDATWDEKGVSLLVKWISPLEDCVSLLVKSISPLEDGISLLVKWVSPLEDCVSLLVKWVSPLEDRISLLVKSISPLVDHVSLLVKFEFPQEKSGRWVNNLGFERETKKISEIFQRLSA